MAGLFQNLGGLFAQRGVQAVAAGLLSGAIGGSALVATGIVPVGGAPAAADRVALLTCPGFGPVLTDVQSGQSLLVTARSADGQWLEVYVGQPGLDRAWAPAEDLRLESAVDGLPVAECAAPATIVPPGATPPPATALPSPTVLATVVPAATPAPTPTTAPTARPTTAPTPTPRATARATPRVTPTPKPTPKPTPTPTPTPPPDTSPPSLSNLVITSPAPDPNDGTYDIFGSGCPGPKMATIRVRVTDASDITTVTLFYWPGNSGVLSTGMTFVGNNNWEATITAGDNWSSGNPDGLINYWVQAVDSEGNQSPALNHSNSYRLYKEICFF